MTIGNLFCAFFAITLLAPLTSAQERTPAPPTTPVVISPGGMTLVSPRAPDAPRITAAPLLFAARRMEPPENQDDPGYAI